MDHNVSAAARYFSDQDNAAEAACYKTAIRNGHTVDAADDCDDGDVGCPDCPFKGRS